MKKKNFGIIKFALLLCVLIPSVVFATEDKYIVDNIKIPEGFYGPVIKSGDFSKFYFSKFTSNDEEIVNEYNWNGEFKKYDGDISDFNYYYVPYDEYGYYDFSPTYKLGRKLMIEESEDEPSTYYYYALENDSKVVTSSNIYSSSSKGESIGSISNFNLNYYNDSKTYELEKIAGGYDYVTKSGDVVLSTTDSGYKIIGNVNDKVTFYNGTTVYIVDYLINNPSTIHKTVSVSTIKELLSKNDLTGIKIKLEFTIDEEDYYSILLGKHTYFVNEDFNKIIYEADVVESDIVDYYAIDHDEKIYVFLDFDKYYEESENDFELDSVPNYTIHTEVFDLDGKSLFGDTNWLNIFYSDLGSMFGITKEKDRYIMKFLTVDGEVMYSKDYTDLFDKFNPYTIYGTAHLADHETNSIETGKYIFNYYYSDYDDEDLYLSDYVFISVNEHYVIEGKDQTYNGKDLTIRFNGDFEKFENLLINDKIVSTDNYTKKSGSVIITLKSDYLKSLGEGSYTVKAAFDDGEFADTSITIPAINPQTGDGIMNSIILGSISLISVIGLLLYKNKERFN